MKKPFRRICIFAILSVILSLTAFAVARNEKVEISFRVGESDIMINGETISVEKPYVVGEGVTLVPVRVITEAFGAIVGWDGETQKVTLTDKDNTIVIYIGNNIADVNGKSEKMLAAPELSAAGFTMVPLRFISETFNAVVGYDEVNKTVSVVKEAEVTVKEGMTFFEAEDNSFYLQIPQNYLLSQTSNRNENEYVFSKKSTRTLRIQTRDVALIRKFVSAKTDNLEQYLNDEQLIQKGMVSDKSFSVGSIQTYNHHEIDYYYYDIHSKNDDGQKTVVRKILFNYGDNTFLVTALIKDTLATFTDDYSDGVLKSTFIGTLQVNIPDDFSSNGIFTESEMELRSEAASEITLKLYKNPESTDSLTFAKKEHEKMSVSRNSDYINISNIEEAVYGNNKGFTYTAKYLSDNSIEKHIILGFDKYTVSLVIGAKNEFDLQNASFAAESFVPLLTEEQIEKLPEFETAANEPETIVLNNVSFSLPDSFDYTVSDDKKFISASDSENMIHLSVYDEAAIVDNQDVIYGLKSIGTAPGFADRVYYAIQRNQDICSILADTVKVYEKAGWEKIGWGGLKNNDGTQEYVKFHRARFSHWIDPGVKIYEYVYYYYTNIDGSYRYFPRYQKKEDVVQQKLNIFVFTFTDLADKENVINIIDNIAVSIQTATPATEDITADNK